MVPAGLGAQRLRPSSSSESQENATMEDSYMPIEASPIDVQSLALIIASNTPILVTRQIQLSKDSKVWPPKRRSYSP